MLIGSVELAEKNGCKPGTVAMVALRLGIPKILGRYMFNAAQAAEIEKNIAKKPGRQPGRQPWKSLGISRQAYYYRLKHSDGKKRPVGRPRGSTKKKAVTRGRDGKKRLSPELIATGRRLLRVGRIPFKIL